MGCSALYRPARILHRLGVRKRSGRVSSGHTAAPLQNKFTGTHRDSPVAPARSGWRRRFLCVLPIPLYLPLTVYLRCVPGTGKANTGIFSNECPLEVDGCRQTAGILEGLMGLQADVPAGIWIGIGIRKTKPGGMILPEHPEIRARSVPQPRVPAC